MERKKENGGKGRSKINGKNEKKWKIEINKEV